jgi:regulator of PEP synthase PpsR (kinase-PPPase family)
MSKHAAFIISDGTGITAESLGHSLLAQFPKIDFQYIVCPYIDTEDKAFQVAERIESAAEAIGVRPIVIDTIVNQAIRKIIHQSPCFVIDVFSTFLKPLEAELKTQSSYSVGGSHPATTDKQYMARIDAVHFAMENDDGSRSSRYEEADIVLIGVSRSGKTPTCLYLALQFGIRAANYPLTDDDAMESGLPKLLRPHRQKLFGLTINPDRLIAIRGERRANSRYSSASQCFQEVEDVEVLFRQERISYINTTDLSVEEISTQIMADAGLDRRTC